jgi:hypothetical protein
MFFIPVIGRCEVLVKIPGPSERGKQTNKRKKGCSHVPMTNIIPGKCAVSR